MARHRRPKRQASRNESMARTRDQAARADGPPGSWPTGCRLPAWRRRARRRPRMRLRLRLAAREGGARESLVEEADESEELEESLPESLSSSSPSTTSPRPPAEAEPWRRAAAWAEVSCSSVASATAPGSAAMELPSVPPASAARSCVEPSSRISEEADGKRGRVSVGRHGIASDAAMCT